MDNEIEEDQSPADLDVILQIVESAKQQGMVPEEVLDEDELDMYNDYVQNELSDPLSHYDNLVDAIDPSYLKRLAGEIHNWVIYDENTRSSWAKREAEGIRMLGVSDKDLGTPPFEGASMVVHPLLAEAVSEFHARAIAEMWPPEGPVKSVLLGEQTPERLAQSERVQNYMNYQYTELMPGAFEEEDSLLFRLPLSGSCFKKVYYDPLSRTICSRFVEPADFIVPFSATDLETASRFTHRYREMSNSVMKKFASGYYKKPKNFMKATNETFDYPAVKTEIDSTEGRENSGADDNVRHTTYEMYVYLEIPGFEDVGEDGELTGIELPFVVWVDRDNNEVLRIQRGWAPSDEYKNRDICFSHYKFMPGLGFYGHGLLHLIGGIANSATGALRALLDAAAFANLQGGFRTRDSRTDRNGDQPISPGEWRTVDASSEELSKAFFKLPYDEPSPTLFKLLEYLDNHGAKFAGIGDVMDGSANPNAPVGTTLALIEQGQKKFSAIHRRLHIAHKTEFRIVSKLNALYLPENGYPYFADSKQRNIYASDFDDRVDVIPVSDPNTVSSSQRIVQAQAVLDLATQHPDKMNVNEALKGMLQAMRVPGFENLLAVDQGLQAHNQKMMELELQLKQAEIEKLQAEKALTSIQGLFSAIQAANIVVMNPPVFPVAADLYLSGGGIDVNGAPLANVAMLTQAPPAESPPMQENTSPNFPATGAPPAPDMPGVADPQNAMAPETSALSGIETARNEM
jgi:hypothetical protein